MNSPPIRYVVITPSRDEERYIGHVLKSLVSQSVQPVEWIIVDDGSRDGTRQIVEQYVRKHDWIRLHHRADRGSRTAGSGVMEAFFDGFEQLKEKDWCFLVKLDADLSLPSDYFEKCFEHFQTRPDLGIAGGLIYCKRDSELQIDAPGDPPFHVRGATKIYRRTCWDQIGGLLRTAGWDTADEIKANCLGWETGTLPDIKALQLRVTGGAYGSWRDSVKNGRGSYLCGYHPLFLAARCARRFLKKPLSPEAFGLAYGYLYACVIKTKRAMDRDSIRYIRRQQLMAILGKPSIYSNRLP